MDFISILGTEISLEGWKRYRGDYPRYSNTDKVAYYTQWNHIEG